LGRVRDASGERIAAMFLKAIFAGATVIIAAGCGGGSETVTVTRQETVTRTETVTKTTSAPPALIVVPLPDHRIAYAPDSIPLGASNAITQIRWKRYGGRVAVGKGVFPSNDCTPSCAEGKVTPIKVTVRLAGVTPCPGGGLLMYRKMEIEGPGFDPGFDEIPLEDSPC
jgi:hypothetical protein